MVDLTLYFRDCVESINISSIPSSSTSASIIIKSKAGEKLHLFLGFEECKTLVGKLENWIADSIGEGE